MADDINSTNSSNLIGVAMKVGKLEAKLAALEATRVTDLAATTDRCAKIEARLDELDQLNEYVRASLKAQKRLTLTEDETMSKETSILQNVEDRPRDKDNMADKNDGMKVGRIKVCWKQSTTGLFANAETAELANRVSAGARDSRARRPGASGRRAGGAIPPSPAGRAR